MVGGIQVDATRRMTLSKDISNSQSWAAGGKFKGFGVRSPDSRSGPSMLRELGEPLHHHLVMPPMKAVIRAFSRDKRGRVCRVPSSE